MIEQILTSLKRFTERNAFYIQGQYFSYGQVAQKVSDIHNSFKQQISDLNTRHIGVIINDDLESYCSCIAVLLSGCGYVPLNPLVPTERNLEIIEQAEVKVLLSSDKANAQQMNPLKTLRTINTLDLQHSPLDLNFFSCHDEDPAYVIFTSGSTGTPKGTPISRGNLNAFLDSVWHLKWKIGPEDRFLQMSSMTFDMSILTFIIPLCVGACIYTVPEQDIKFMTGYRLMEEMDITFIAVVPSTVAYLRPYFSDIRLQKMRYSLVCGEAFPIDLAAEWASCVPNAQIVNIYGPTEATVFTHSYHYRKGEREKSHNGIMAIGEIVKNMDAVILDEDGKPAVLGRMGELCVAGKQLCGGYLLNPEKNRESFFHLETHGEMKRFYRTGDVVYQDAEKTFFYVGRKDNQVKIQGFRVELGEIEKHVRDFIDGRPAVALAQWNAFGNQQIHLFVEGNSKTDQQILAHLKSRLPYYMIPSGISFVDRMPLNANGKIDRVQLAGWITCPGGQEQT